MDCFDDIPVVETSSFSSKSDNSSSSSSSSLSSFQTAVINDDNDEDEIDDELSDLDDDDIVDGESISEWLDEPDEIEDYLVPSDSITISGDVDDYIDVADDIVAALNRIEGLNFNSFSTSKKVEFIDPLAKLIPREKQGEIIQQMTIKLFEVGHYIIRQGEMGDEFFIIVEGSVEVKEDRFENDKSKSVTLVTLREGHFFGEMSLILDEPRVASVVAAESVSCLCLSKTNFKSAFSDDAFSQLLNDVLEKRKRLRQDRELKIAATMSQKRSAEADPPSPKITQQQNAPDEVTMTLRLTVRKLASGDKLVNKYLIGRLLGSGSFGEVYLCKDETTDNLFAMKVLNRPKKMLKSELEEISVMKKLRHENIVNLIEVFIISFVVYV